MPRILPLTFACLLTWLSPVSAEPGEGSPTGSAETEAPVSVASVIADNVTTTTMTAMSPLLVISAQGAWEYYHSDPGGRSSLPWYTSPWLWVSLLVMGGLFTLNTAIGNAVPLLKTPMNVVEEHENKITGLLIGLPMVLTRLFPDLEIPSSMRTASSMPGAFDVGSGIVPVAAISGPWAAALIAVPVIVACYLLVWLTFHSLHVIALVSPFGIVDTGLKFSRLGLLGIILALWFISPLLSAVLCAAIIVFSYFIAGWSFRLLIFGTLLSWDLLLFRHRRPQSDTDINARGFLCRAIDAAPVRSYGTLTREANGSYVFHYRPWLCMPRQSVALPAESLTIQRGIISPTARADTLTETGGGDSNGNLIRFRPRFRGHEDAIASHLGAREVEDSIITRGFRQATAWLRDLCQLSPPATTA